MVDDSVVSVILLLPILGVAEEVGGVFGVEANCSDGACSAGMSVDIGDI